LNPEVGKDHFADDLGGQKNWARVKEAYEFVIKWCTPKDEKAEEKDELVPPKEWETGVDMRPWKDFPDRPYP
jgi:hypothetical protein